VKISLGSDHGGFDLKQEVAEFLRQQGHDVVDAGCDSLQSVDYPDFAGTVCGLVRSGECERGILICGTGIGMSIAANRYREIRAALCHEGFTARMSREHNNANVLCLGARVIGPALALDIVGQWLATEFAVGRHQRRLDMLS
jgi:ribose 5-phosphate isomerase B